MLLIESACQVCAGFLNVYLEAIFKNLFSVWYNIVTASKEMDLQFKHEPFRALSQSHPPGQGRWPAASCFPFGAWTRFQDSPSAAVWFPLVTSSVPASILQMTYSLAGPGRAASF